MFLFSAMATAGQNYQNAYLYSGMFRVKSSTSLLMSSLTRTRLYSYGTEQDKSLVVTKIVGVL